MAARSTRQRDDDVLDPVDPVDEDESDDFDEDGPDLDEDGPHLDADLDDSDLGSDVLDEDEVELDDGETSLEAELEAEQAGDPDLDADTAGVEPPAEASFDDEDEGLVAVVTAADEDSGDPDGLREGEFVCRSCHMAKRETQLADEAKLLCRDCA